jgi:SET domain-containing protein
MRKPKINTDYTWFNLEMVKSKIHRWGLIAKQDIPARRYVIEYTGVLRNRRQAKAHRHNTPEEQQIYAWEVPVNDKSWVAYWELDGFTGGSGAEFVNHSCDPNLRAVFHGKRCYYFSTRRIKKGEELTIFYGEGYFNSRHLKCICGEPNCISKRR